MGKAYVCDHCGKLFSADDLKYQVPVILQNNAICPLSFSGLDIKLEICPGCRASFQKWWDEGAVQKTTDPKHPYAETLYEVDEND